MNIPRSVIALGFVSMFMDISSEMIHALLPAYMSSALGASAMLIGIIEGSAEALALILKVVSGKMSDRWGKRKPFLVAGYGLGALSKPLFAFAAAPWSISIARLVDRTGKGLRGAPRDALIADVTPAEKRGEAYGLRQSMDSIGAFLGPVIAIGLMLLFQNDYRAVFLAAIVPGLFSVAILLLFVRESGVRRSSGIQVDMKMGKPFWLVILVAVMFTFSRYSEAFLVLRAQNTGMEPYLLPVVFIVMNLFYALGAWPLGKFSDRFGRKGMLASGIVALLAADGVLAFAGTPQQVLVGASLWGLHMAFTQGIFSALIAETTHAKNRATGFGIFGLVTGVTVFFSAFFAGAVWDNFGAEKTFLSGAIFCLLTLFGLALLNGKESIKHVKY